MTLPELLRVLERRAAEAEREGATAPVANVYRLVLEEMQTVANASGSAVTNGPQTDRLLSASEVARRLGVSRRYVYDHADRFPFTRRLGSGTVRFSECGLERWLARQR